MLMTLCELIKKKSGLTEGSLFEQLKAALCRSGEKVAFQTLGTASVGARAQASMKTVNHRGSVNATQSGATVQAVSRS